MGRRPRAREFALQVLFQLDLTGGDPDEVLQQFWSRQAAESDVREFAERLVHGVVDGRAQIDARIVEAAEHWRIERMGVVDRNVLRIAVYELASEEGTPPAVVIDESIEIAKRFGGAGSGGFINGVLDSIRASGHPL
jgi:N utilization substance protein B